MSGKWPRWQLCCVCKPLWVENTDRLTHTPGQGFPSHLPRWALGEQGLSSGLEKRQAWCTQMLGPRAPSSSGHGDSMALAFEFCRL